MSVEFFADRSTADRRRDVATVAPDNPFASAEYARARELMGDTAYTLGLVARGGRGKEDTVLTACFGFVRSGRMNCSMEVPSLPTLADGKTFYAGLLKWCQAARVTALDLNSYASEAVDVPSLPRETLRRHRAEWLLDLADGTWHGRLSTNHRRSISRAVRSGISVRRTTGDQACQTHHQLVADSFARRAKRGESLAVPGNIAELAHALTTSGVGQLFQAVKDDRVLSSIMMLRGGCGAYYQSGGTSSEGMELGASVFLMNSAARALADEGVLRLNLGDARPDNPGLRRFKESFGAREVPLMAVGLRPVTMWYRALAAPTRVAGGLFA